MNSIFDVANYFLQRLDSVSPKKLQKLCYYAEAWSQALLEKSMITDTKFEAWRHGPVSPGLYHSVKEFGWQPIDKDYLSDKSDDISDQKDTELLEAVITTYGHLSGNELEAITHTEDPWLNKRKGYEASDSGNEVISTEDMHNFYKSIYIGD